MSVPFRTGSVWAVAGERGWQRRAGGAVLVRQLDYAGSLRSGRSVSAPGRQWFLAVPGRLGLGLGGRLQGEPLGGSAPGGDVPGGTAEIGLAALQQLQPDLAAGGEGGHGLPQQ